MDKKYSREELLGMTPEEFDKAMREMKEEAEEKGKEKLKLQIALEKRLIKAIDKLWSCYQEHGDGKLKPYIRNDLERVVRAKVSIASPELESGKQLDI